MRINLNTSGANEVSTAQTSLPTATTPKSWSASEVDKLAGDTVSLSSLTAQTMQMSTMRQEKVNALRQQLENGEYNIDPRGTAEAMLSK